MPHRHIGLLGGSFNPAHEGHRFISLKALKQLDLDQVWWLVSPQNPLKSAEGMADFKSRVRYARNFACHPRIHVSDFESRARTRYSIDTVRRLQKQHRNTLFVWLIGADNFIQMPRWRFWTRLLQTVPVAVYDRVPLAYPALSGAAAVRFQHCRYTANSVLIRRSPPAWSYMFGETHPQSATDIRHNFPNILHKECEILP